MRAATREVATVFGGSGFIGRYVVKRLAQLGYIVRVAVRRPETAMFLKPMGGVGQVVPLFASITNAAQVQRAVEGASVVVNLVGILAEQHRGDFDAIHHQGAAQVARIASECGVTHLVQISAIGADPASASQYAASKGRGEAAVLAAFPGAVILRPSIVFGLEDNFFNQFAAIARLSPVMPVISGASKFQPVYVGNVADAVIAAITRKEAAGQVFSLGGPRVWTFREILAYILQETGRHRWMLDVPPNLASLQARIMERLPGKMLTQDQLLMLQSDNVVPDGAAGLEALGVDATPVELVVPAYLRRYAAGGEAAFKRTESDLIGRRSAE